MMVPSASAEVSTVCQGCGGLGRLKLFWGLWEQMLFVEVPDLRLYFSEMRDTASVASLWPLGGLVHESFFPPREHF